MQINHAEYQRKVKSMSIAQLLYVIKDCKEAIAANKENPKCGVYSDEISYCSMELKRRGYNGK